MTLPRWLWITAAMALLPMSGIVPRGTLLHALCVLPFGLTVLLLVPLALLFGSLAALRSVLR